MIASGFPPRPDHWERVLGAIQHEKCCEIDFTCDIIKILPYSVLRPAAAPPNPLEMIVAHLQVSPTIGRTTDWLGACKQTPDPGSLARVLGGSVGMFK